MLQRKLLHFPPFPAHIRAVVAIVRSGTSLAVPGAAPRDGDGDEAGSSQRGPVFVTTRVGRQGERRSPGEG
jgi:hypothetical protein